MNLRWSAGRGRQSNKGTQSHMRRRVEKGRGRPEAVSVVMALEVL